MGSRGTPAFPVYQIDFSAVAAGKRVAATKRRIRWRFGFPNLKAIEEGRSGTDCRGEEHEVVVIWSVTSGKRQILMDGREVHYSANRVGILDFSWNTKGNHVLKVTCHAAPPMTPTPGFRQYDLFIDGQTFFNMPKVYELGIRGSTESRSPSHYGGGGFGGGYDSVSPRSAYSGGYGGGGGGGYEREESIRPPRTNSEEDELLQQAIRASLEESKRHLKENTPPDVLDSAPAAEENTDLLDFGGPEPSFPAIMPDASSAYGAPALPPSTSYDGSYGAPLPVPQQQPSYDGGYGAPPPPSQYGAPPSAYGVTPPAYGAPPPQQQYLALPSSQPIPAPAPPSSQPPGAAYGAPPGPPPSYGAPPPPAYGAPPQRAYSAGSNQYEDPFAPKPPTFHETANDILKAYGPSTTTPLSNAASGRYQPGQPFFADNVSTPPPQNYMSPSPAYDSHSMNGHGAAETTPLSMDKLIITEEEPKNPFDAAMKKLVNIDHIDEPAEEALKLTMKKMEDEKAKKAKGKSVPLPPVAQRRVGSGATLGEISQVKVPVEKKSVMQPPPGLFQGDAAMYGALVVHGQAPPPVQPQGFGMVHMQSQQAAARQYMYGAPPQFQPHMQHQPPAVQQQPQGYGYR